MALPALAFVQAGQSGSQNALGSKGRFDIAGKNGTVAYLRCDDLINREQKSLTKVGLRRIGIRIGSGRARGFAVKIGGIVVATTIDDLGG